MRLALPEASSCRPYTGHAESLELNPLGMPIGAFHDIQNDWYGPSYLAGCVHHPAVVMLVKLE